MAASLIAISFVCAILLALFVPVKRLYSDIPSLAIVFWLLLANILHGVNSSLFSNTVGVSSFVWCDISTKLLLGVNVAIPGAFICIGRRLEMVSSSRVIISNPIVKRNSMIFEVLMCYILPIIYMLLHLIAQHHRFDIIEDFGCFAAVHPSTPGVILVWVFPLVLAAVSLLLNSLALQHCLKLSKITFSAHLESRATLTSSLFTRRVATSMAITCISLVTTLFSLFSAPRLISWQSWSWAHANMGRAVVLDPEDISNTRLRWWTILALSVAYIILSFAIGEEARDAFKWMKSVRVSCDGITDWFKSLRPRRTSLPLHLHSPHAPVFSPAGSLPHMVDLKSGWDDMVDFKPTNTRSTWSRSTRSMTTSPLSSPISSRSPSSASFRDERNVTGGAMTSEDRAFMDSTMSYLGSPTAQTLGITQPLRVATSDHLTVPRESPSPIRFAAPSPSLVAPRRPVPPSLVFADPVLPQDTPEFTSPTISSPPPASARPVATIGSVIRADWPVPPQTPSPSGSVSRYSSHSPTHSASSSVEEMAHYVSQRAVSPSHSQSSSSHTRPFDSPFYGGSSTPGVVHVQLPYRSPSLSSVSSIKPPSLKKSLQNLRGSWNRERTKHNSGQSQVDGILMTVVQETV